MSERSFRLSPEYGTGPVWVNGPGGGEDTPSAAELGLSGELADRLAEWDAEYQATFDGDYPPDSGFDTAEQERSFMARGQQLARDLSVQLGVVVPFRYKPDHG